MALRADVKPQTDVLVCDGLRNENHCYVKNRQSSLRSCRSQRELGRSGPKRVSEASKTLRNIRSVYIKEFTAAVENDRITSYRVNAKVTFEMER